MSSISVQPAEASGESNYFISGFNLVQIASGFNQVTISGGLANMSGLGVTVNSGVAVTISGNVISQASGAWMASGIIPNISGQAVSVSGNVVNPVSGKTLVFDPSGAVWKDLWTSASGQNNVSIGNPVPFNYVLAPLSGIGFGATSGIPSLSGGVVLSSGNVAVAVVRNLSGNADMWVGGSGSRPFSGFGFVLHGGDGLTMSIRNFNQLYLFANTSGQLISYIGSQY